MSHAPIKMPTAMAAASRASQVPAAASAAVAAQAIDKNASAKVAVRDEICRRRKSPRLAWVRNQSWTASAAAGAATMPTADMTASLVESSASAAMKGMNTIAIAPKTASGALWTNDPEQSYRQRNRHRRGGDAISVHDKSRLPVMTTKVT
jgi:hypothetical protein